MSVDAVGVLIAGLAIAGPFLVRLWRFGRTIEQAIVTANANNKAIAGLSQQVADNSETVLELQRETYRLADNTRQLAGGLVTQREQVNILDRRFERFEETYAKPTLEETRAIHETVTNGGEH